MELLKGFFGKDALVAMYQLEESNLKGKMDSTHNGVVDLAHTIPKHKKVVVDGLTIDESGNIAPFAPQLQVPFKFR